MLNSARGWLRLPIARVRKALRDLRGSVSEEPVAADPHSPAGEIASETDDPLFTPDWDQIGRQGSYLLLLPPATWVRRHVETIELKSLSVSHRRLTVDLQLPTDPTVAASSTQEEATFWLPFTTLAKKPPRSNIDVRDEEGRVLPLLSPRENAAISLAAVNAAAEQLLPNPPSELLEALFRELTERAGIEADIALAVAQQALVQEAGEATTSAGRAFDEALRSLAGNSWLWLPLAGAPGSRRVIKFRFDFELEPQHLRPRRPQTRKFLVRAEESHAEYPIDLEEQGDANPRSMPRRLLARMASATGLAAIDIAVDTPYIVGCRSYHLQMETPAGVEARGVRALARLRSGGTPYTTQAKHLRRRPEHRVHLYLTDVIVEKVLPAIVMLRVGRRGFLTLSWLASVFISVLLWAFYLRTEAAITAGRETAVAALLFVPALLIALLIRPGEHPLATRLLFGVRALVGFSALCAFSAAAAVAGVRPADWDVDTSWLLCAILSGTSSLWLTASWILATDWAYQWAEATRERWHGHRKIYGADYIAVTVVATVALGLGAFGPGIVEGLEGLFIGALLACAAGLAFVWASYARVDLPDTAALQSAVAFAVGWLAAAAAALLMLHLAADWSWEGAWRVGAVLAGVALALSLFQERSLRRQEALEGQRTS